MRRVRQALALVLLGQQLASVKAWGFWSRAAATHCRAVPASDTRHNNVPCGQPMFWFTALSTYVEPDTEYWHYAQAALLSAKQNSPMLVPVLLFADQTGDKGGSRAHRDVLQWFQGHGAIVYLHRLSFLDDLKAVSGRDGRKEDYHLLAESIFLRLDLPLIMPQLLKRIDTLRPKLAATINRDYALYTDVDVQFWHPFELCTMQLPRIMAVAAETDRSPAAGNFNSGVMLVNLKGLAQEWPKIYAYGKRRRWEFAAHDQSLLVDYFFTEAPEREDRLPEAYNWKGYWGSSASIVITHWHGPKAERCMPCYSEARKAWKLDRIEECGCEVYDALYMMAPDEGRLYEEMLQAHLDYMHSAATEQWRLP